MDVFAEVDIILEMKIMVPESVLDYLQPGTMILFDHVTVSTSSFIHMLCCWSWAASFTYNLE